MFKFEQLEIYKDSIALVSEVYKITKLWPRGEVFGLTDQFRRAAVSIALNIAEGSSRTANDFKHFLTIARGSCFECVAILQIAELNQYVTEAEYKKLYDKLEILSKRINALGKSI